MKRTVISIAILILAAGMSVGIAGCDQAGGKPRIGVALSSMDDSFVTAAR